MKTRKTYITPEAELVVLSVNDKVMQDTLQNTFSGGDSLDTGIIIGGGDEGDDDNRINRWNSHLWDEFD